MEDSVVGPLDNPKVKPQLGYHESLIFNSVELAVETVDFLLRIPDFTLGLLDGDVEVDNGLVNALFNLHIGQSTWIKSTGNGETDPLMATQEPSLDRNQIFQTHVLPEMGCQLDSDKTPSHHISISMNDALNLKRKKRNTDKISIPAAAEGMEKEDAISGNKIRTKNSLFYNVVKMEDEDPNGICSSEESSSFMNSEEEGSRKIKNGETHQKIPDELTCHDGNRFQGDSMDDSFRSEMSGLYGQVYREYLKQHFQGNRKIPGSSGIGLCPNSPSSGLLLFQMLIHNLKRLIGTRLVTLSSQRSQNLKDQGHCWDREKSCKEIIRNLKGDHETMLSKWRERMEELRDRIGESRKEIEDWKEQGLMNIKDIIRMELVLGLEQRKRMEFKMGEMGVEEGRKRTEMETRFRHFMEEEEGFRREISSLEDSLRKLLESYSGSMIEKQRELDHLETTVQQNKIRIGIMERTFAETEERFEEMRITKILKELLRNLEMADNFKRNRAARIIQATWRRYRQRKYRRMRRRKLRRKPKIPGQFKPKERRRDGFSSDISSITTGRS